MTDSPDSLDHAPASSSAAEVLLAVRRRRPLVHSITNDVVMAMTANGLLALGASPIMAHAPEEAEEVVCLASALLANLGTLTPARAEAMRIATRTARIAGIPWVLDPVGVGATRLRRATAEALLAEKPAVIRGNAAEIAVLAGDAADGRGVDADGDGLLAGHEAARRLARTLGCVVAVTGVVDCVTDGRRAVHVHNGHPALALITGTGCLASAIVAAALGAGAAPLDSAAAALVWLGLAGERAAEGEAGPGTMAVRLIDRLAALTPAEVAEGQRLS